MSSAFSASARARDLTKYSLNALQKLPIPVNIITGALGVGKTTAVAHLLRSKPPGEKWALLVNEFGSLGIDAALLEAELQEAAGGQQEAEEQQPGQGGGGGAGGAGASSISSSNTSTITGTSSSSISTSGGPTGSSGISGSGSGGGYVVRELAGGCMCCTLSGPLGVAIAQLVRTAKPDRLIIEPSGLGHPAGLLDTLYGEHLRSALDVRAVVCLVDVRAAAAELEAAAGGAAGGAAAVPSETFQDQVNVADVVVGHKSDLAAPQQLDTFWRWAQQLYPPKAQVLLASHGAVDPAVLDMPRAPVFRPLFNPQSHSSRRRAAQQQRQRQRQGQGQGQSTTATATAAASGSASAPTALLAGLTLEGPLSGPAAGEATDGEVGIEAETEVEAEMASQLQVQLVPRRPLRFPSQPAPGPGASQEQQGPQPVEVEVEGQGRQQVSCGWLFSAEDVFERERLTAVLAAAWPRAARLKGIFRVGKAAYVVPYRQPDVGSSGGAGGAGGTAGGSGGCGVELRPISYRRESRLEVIVDVPGAAKVVPCEAGVGLGAASGEQSGGAQSGVVANAGAGAIDVTELGAAVAAADWDAVERALVACLKP